MSDVEAQRPLAPTSETRIIDETIRAKVFSTDWRPDIGLTKHVVEILRNHADALESGEVDIVSVKGYAEVGDVTKPGDRSHQVDLTGIKSLTIVTKGKNE